MALRADIGGRIDRLEKRTKEGYQALGQRIDRLEDRTRADHQELVAEIGGVKTEIGEVKTAVSVLGAKLSAAHRWSPAIGPGGVEPPSPVPKTGVLPLDDGPED